MKKAELFFTAILLPIDYLMVVSAGLLAYFLRFNALAQLRPIIFELPFWHYLGIILLVALFSIIVFAFNGLYRIGRQRFSRELAKIFFGVTTAVMLIVLFVFFQRTLFSSRFIVLMGWLLAIILVALGRFFIHLARLNIYKLGRGLEPTVIVGDGPFARDILDQLIKERGFGYRIIDNSKSVDEFITRWQDRAQEIRVVILGDVTTTNQEIYRLVNFCNEHQIVFKYVVDSYGALLTNIKSETIAGVPVIEIKRTALDGWGRIIKRFFDIIISFLALIILSPLFLIIAVIIKLDSPGPIFVKLKRVGCRNQCFPVYKFRSMVIGAEKMKEDLMSYNERGDGPLFKMQNDPRVTRFGKFIRKTSLDELPQLYNVLIGQMSLVGPRPHEPQEVERYKSNHKQLLTIKPGITGLAQISGRSNLTFDDEANLDIYYIENWSLGYDGQILIKTLPVVLSKKNVA
ncbi:MAG: sugar transferase [Patescibacteria group bacterium]|nr:sugar transferase [Patescibacteria group bacterium]MDD5121609.1 sugar transferase [Patescibacteria group bacterium]MDD5222205.1 sugar transferase [Patescibacteria group bacterium]MDD5396227.1 sugar transferase [Patescibacteria group bacterium]